MPELRLLPKLTDRETVESVLRVWQAMPWREQKCALCYPHPRHATPCPETSDDDETQCCGCGWRDKQSYEAWEADEGDFQRALDRWGVQ